MVAAARRLRPRRDWRRRIDRRQGSEECTVNASVGLSRLRPCFEQFWTAQPAHSGQSSELELQANPIDAAGELRRAGRLPYGLKSVCCTTEGKSERSPRRCSGLERAFRK